MKTKFLMLLFFVVSYSFSQSVNDYKAVIIPVKYDFLKDDNQYRLNTLTKINLKKAGFEAFYNNESIPKEYTDRCSLLYVDVKKENAFLITKLFIIFKDCNGAIIYKSDFGKSKEKEYQPSYTEALNKAFESVYALQYKYSGLTPEKNIPAEIAPVAVAVPVVSDAKAATTTAVEIPVIVAPVAIAAVAVAAAASTSNSNNSDKKEVNLLYAQPTTYGYQLIDNDPKVVMKVYKTSNSASFMAIKGSLQGVLISKDNQWFFEYYQNDKLITEKIDVKF